MNNIFKKKFMKVPNLNLASALHEIGRNAYVDWMLILILCVFVFISLSITGAYLYWQISTGNLTNASSNVSISKKSVENKELENIINIFNAKKETFDINVKNKTIYKDPSKY